MIERPTNVVTKVIISITIERRGLDHPPPVIGSLATSTFSEFPTILNSKNSAKPSNRPSMSPITTLAINAHPVVEGGVLFRMVVIYSDIS
jgi:hypothetical protein